VNSRDSGVNSRDSGVNCRDQGLGNPSRGFLSNQKKLDFLFGGSQKKNQNRDFVVFENPEQKKSWGILDSFGLPNSALKWIIFWGNSKK
jgi:hypothetical protein